MPRREVHCDNDFRKQRVKFALRKRKLMTHSVFKPEILVFHLLFYSEMLGEVVHRNTHSLEGVLKCYCVEHISDISGHDQEPSRSAGT